MSKKYIQWLKTLSLIIQYEYIHPLGSCCLPNLRRNSPKIRTYSNSRSLQVINFGASGKRSGTGTAAYTSNFLLVINSNFGRISYRFRDIDAFSSSLFSLYPTLV